MDPKVVQVDTGHLHNTFILYTQSISLQPV